MSSFHAFEPIQMRLDFGELPTGLLNSILRHDPPVARPLPREDLTRIAERCSGGDAVLGLAVRHLLILCNRLLDEYPANDKYGGEITVLDSMRYQLGCGLPPGVTPVRMGPDLQERFGEQLLLTQVDLLHTLKGPDALLLVAYRDDGIGSHLRSVLHEEPTPTQLERIIKRACEQVWRLLRCDPRIGAIRRAIAGKTVDSAGTELIALAMRARPHPRAASLLAEHLALVARHQRMYRRMARENPKLLAALTAWLLHDEVPGSEALDDAVPLMRKSLLAAGLPPRAWRCLLEHGMRPFVLRQGDPLYWDTLLWILDALDAARWPALPPRGFFGLLRDTAGFPSSYFGNKDGQTIPGWFWNWTCHAAHQCARDTRAYEALKDEITRWAYWVRKYQPRPDANQQRAGLRWLRAWVDRVEQEATLSDVPQWATWLRLDAWEPKLALQAVALLSPRAVVQESWAMHNCADQYLPACRAGTDLLVSLRCAHTGRSVALVGLRRQARNPHAWTVTEVGGPCNKPVAKWVRRVATQLGAMVNAEAALEAARLELRRICGAAQTEAAQQAQTKPPRRNCFTPAP